MTTERTHHGRVVTFDHMRYIPVKEGFKVYYMSDDYDSLSEVTLPAFAVDAWEEFIDSINGKIPSESEVEMFLQHTFLKQKNEEE